MGCGVAVTMTGGGSFEGGSAVGMRVGVEVGVGATVAAVAVTIGRVGTSVATGIDGSGVKAIIRRSPSAMALPRPSSRRTTQL